LKVINHSVFFSYTLVVFYYGLQKQSNNPLLCEVQNKMSDAKYIIVAKGDKSYIVHMKANKRKHYITNWHKSFSNTLILTRKIYCQQFLFSWTVSTTLKTNTNLTFFYDRNSENLYKISQTTTQSL
jgi:hypothetical protein